MDAPLPKGIDQEQTQNVFAIWREFKRAYPDLPGGVALTLAAITNADAESDLRNVRTGVPGEDSAGLFQLNITNPHGAALVGLIDRRLNPAANTRGIIASLEDSGKPVFDAIDRNETVAEIAGLFRRYVERPANAEQRQRETEDLARRIFPEYANTRARDLPKLETISVPMDYKTIAIALGGVAATLFALGVL